jgi:hypothetical protein
MIRCILILAAALALADCTPMANKTGARETVTVTAGATATTAPAPAGIYSGAGVFSVGDQPSGGAQRSIPPGRYTVTVTPGETTGTWIRCSSVVDCNVGSPNQPAIDNALSPDYSSVMEILPTDKAIWMRGITLTRIP